MGNELSALSGSTRQRSVFECINQDGSIDRKKYRRYRQIQEEEWQQTSLATFMRHQEYTKKRRAEEALKELESHPPRRTRSCKKHYLEILDENEQTVRLTPRLSQWWGSYVVNPQIHKSWFLKTFRLRFRLPYDQFLELVDRVKGCDLFKRWHGTRDAVGDPCSPIELLVLGVLRYLGRGWTFDDLCETTGISSEVHSNFFSQFIEYGSTVLYEEFVVAPNCPASAAECMHEMAMAGYHGCVGSTDATHVMMEKCSARLKQSNTGFKMPHTARTYNITVNHRRRILASTSGHPARRNDKTLVLFDKFVRGIHEGKHLDDVEFELQERNSAGEVVSVKYQGVWLMVDNGYLKWAVTIPPIKEASTHAERRWSEWLESMRKDVECTFGILKGRWRILKTGIRQQTIEACDKVWLTCCALHNWLLEVDGLDEVWTDGVLTGVTSMWEGELGNHDAIDTRHYAHPFAIQRLTRTELCEYDPSGMGRGSDCESEPRLAREEPAQQSQSLPSVGPRVVRNLSRSFFRGRLIEHFSILFHQNQIKWPKRSKASQPSL